VSSPRTATAFVVLARAFRSVLLPLKAVALNLLSVAAAWGVLTLVWQHGYGSNVRCWAPGPLARVLRVPAPRRPLTDPSRA
jgi:uncharacterized membrane protein YdfJ with MMPL/SSD domain